MDLRVYVDGVARIICDLTRSTTVHDIIIALAQYKGKPGRYSLIERAPDGAQRILSPNELTRELAQHADWIYILRHNSPHAEPVNGQTRSKSLDGRKPTAEIPSAVTSSSLSSTSSSPPSTSGHVRTVQPALAHGFAIPSSTKKPRSHLVQSDNINNNNNNSANELPSPVLGFTDPKRSSRAPVHVTEQDLDIVEHERGTHRRLRTKSLLSSSSSMSSKCDTSAFQVVPTPVSQQQQQYLALLKVLKSQETQVAQQHKELIDRQREIDYREKNFHHIAMELLHQPASTSDEPLASDVNLHQELELEKKLHSTYEHLQQQLARCSANIEQKRRLQEQIQLNIDQTHQHIDSLQTKSNENKQDIHQYQHDLERCNATLHQQEGLGHVLSKRNDDIEHVIQERRQQINELESELIKLDNVLINTGH